MQVPALPFVALVIAGFVLTSGCTQGISPAVPVSGAPLAPPDLKSLALGPADLPSCFSLSGGQVKGSGDVGQLAKDLGWQAGYSVSFTCPGPGGPTVVLHSLAVYPEESMHAIVTMVDSQDRPAGFVFEDLSFPGRETEMRGFYGRAESRGPGNESSGEYLVSGGQTGTETMARNDIAEIIISRGKTFEVLRMSGPMTNATLLVEIAGRALSKAP